ncbi:ArsR/SmtB family transcription factor [Halegenticoccus tardaugens]|uniref:ArsR/SmtB family transcription factor n=1 Tax=Halegenticoccus tardaugens TaxID=2071624 RepID=UPI00100AF60D|nr:metalloregulator ArsR/SmtB family transcription factor [Halegenticoccus tardaugens]
MEPQTTPTQDIENDTECCTSPVATEANAIATDVQLLSALGNDTRYEALRLIAGSNEGVCVCQLQPALGVSQGAVSQALSRLHSAGLVTRRKEGRWRYYSATPAAEQLLGTLDEIRGAVNE